TSNPPLATERRGETTDMLGTPTLFQPNTEAPAQMRGEIANGYRGLDGIGREGVDQQPARRGLVDAARAQIEERGLVEIAHRGAMAAFDVVREDLELGLGIDGGARAQQQVAVELMRIGLV